MAAAMVVRRGVTEAIRLDDKPSPASRLGALARPSVVLAEVGVQSDFDPHDDSKEPSTGTPVTCRQRTGALAESGVELRLGRS